MGATKPTSPASTTARNNPALRVIVIGRSTIYLFAIAAGMMVVIHLVAGCQRPRAAVIVSGILWLL